MKSLIVVFLSVLSFSIKAQAPVYDDLTFEEDSITKAYRPVSKKFAYIKSKKGTGGVARTEKADSIRSLPITDIVLVYSETSASAMANREEANRERWENLLTTYPEVFQFNTNYKNLLQYGGDTTGMKSAQGFYIYYGSNQPEVKAVAETPKTETKKETKSEPVTETKSKNKKEKEEKAEEKEKPVKEKKERKPKEEPKKEEVVKNEPVVEEPPVKTFTKREGYSKPKRAKNPKACRQPCYVGGDEGLNNFWKESIELSKKQKKHSKDLVSNVKLQLNFDGSIKKSMVTGENEELNKQVTNAIGNMDLWQPAVKGGLTVKSEVKMTLIYDKSSKSMVASDIVIIPRPGPKCECISDAEMFGE